MGQIIQQRFGKPLNLPALFKLRSNIKMTEFCMASCIHTHPDIGMQFISIDVAQSGAP